MPGRQLWTVSCGLCGTGHCLETLVKASGMMAIDFPTIDKKDETHQMMMEIEPLLIASVYRT